MSSKIAQIFFVMFFISLAAPSPGKYSGGTGEPNDPYLIATPNDLNSIGLDPNDWDKNFLMINDINMVSYSYTTALIAPDINNLTLNFQGTPFSGVFDGNGHIIFSLVIDDNNVGNDYLGLFGKLDQGSNVKQLKIEGADINGGYYSKNIGGLCGWNEKGNINNCSVSGSITSDNASWSLGGLCGYNSGGTISDCYSTGSVNGAGDSIVLGGLCGKNGYGGTISDCYSTCSVIGGNNSGYMGGLCGWNSKNTSNGQITINNCYATGFVTGDDYVGGLCGYNWYGDINDCYATGPVTGRDYIGGLCGENTGDTISNCYSRGPVTGRDYVGGLCGKKSTGSINYCYFLDTAGSDNGNGEPLTDAQMKQQSSFVSWDFITPIWRIYEGVRYPRLAWESAECPYCVASGGGDVYIRDVKIGSISNTGTDSNGYTDYISMQTNLDTGFAYPTFVNVHFDQLIENHCRIYIDWNQDCDFDDPNEEIVPELLPYSAMAYFVEITPPAGAATGETGMRVRVTGEMPPNPCGSTPQGEVEDYTIIITDQGACGETQFGGGCGTPNEPYLIYTPEHLRAVGNSNWTWGRHFELAEDIDLGECCPNNFSIIGDGYVVYFPFEPPTEVGVLFTGVFDGNGHTISNAHYEDNDGTAIGLFGTVGPDAEIRDLILSNPHIEINTTDKVGALAGELFQGDVFRCQVRDASIQGDNLVGGLVGYSYGGLIAGCYATGTVSGNEAVGGLVGQITASVSNCWTNNQVTGSQSVGGLIGVIDSGSVSRCYAAGPVSGTSDCGGLIGTGSGNIGLSFWDVNSTGQSSSAGGIPKTTAEMYMRITFTDAGWDFVEESANGTFDIWDICEGTNYPKFSWQVPIEGDLVCPDGVDFIDYSVLANEWRLERLEQDYNSDGRVNFRDWAIFANNWDGNYTELSSFLDRWLARSASQADIAPTGGDNFVDWQDLMLFCENWLLQ